MNLIDLTIPIHNGSPSFPGEPGGHFLPFADLAAQGWVSHQLVLYTHLGTHIDAPRHFLAGGAGVDAWPLSQLCGPAMVATLRTAPRSGEVDYTDFDWPRPPAAGDRILLHTGWGRHWGRADYFSGFPSLGLPLVERLVARGIALLGMDTPTPHETQPQAVHEALLGASVVVLEGLVHLEEAPGPFGELFCLPLPLVGLDGAPCRAVLRPEGGQR